MNHEVSNGVNEPVLAVLQKHLKDVNVDSEFPVDAELAQFGLDSLSAVNLLLDLEDTFEICFPDSMMTPETFRTASTIQGAIRLLTEKEH